MTDGPIALSGIAFLSAAINPQGCTIEEFTNDAGNATITSVVQYLLQFDDID